MDERPIEAGIPVLDLGAGDYPALGRRHAAAWGERAVALYGIRWALTRQRAHTADPARLQALAEAHLPVLAAFDAGLHAELCALASEAGLAPWQAVILNHYTDFRDIPADTEGCSVVYAPLPDGPVAAQTWDMHGTAEPFVGLLRLTPPDGPPAVLFTIAGCHGMCGLNAAGVGICINNLTPTDARVGVVWPALVRRMLRETTAAAALEVLHGARLGSGHNYLVADPTAVYNVETTGRQYRLTHSDRTLPYWHTNHYRHPDLLPLEATLSKASTTRERFAVLNQAFEAAPPQSIAEVWRLLGSHEGHPRSICSHVAAGGGDPSASKTCGGVVLDLARRRVLAHRGCLNGFDPVEVEL